MAIVYDKGSVTLFENGSQVVTGSVTAVNSNTYNLSLGRIYNTKNGYNFDGSIDEVAIYNRALTANEVNLITRITLGGVQNNIISENTLKTYVDGNNQLYIPSLTAPTAVSVLSLDGKTVYNNVLQNNQSIDLSTVSQGM